MADLYSSYGNMSWTPPQSKIMKFGDPASYSPTLDLFTGLVLVGCFVFGTPANISALCYFLSTPSHSLPQKLYIMLTSLDLVICLSPLPVIVSLLSMDRDPGLFASQVICTSWTLVFEFVQRAGVFLVMLLSVTRTIAILRPFLHIQGRVVFLLFLADSLLSLVLTGVNAYFKVDHVYVVDSCYCTKFASSTHRNSHSDRWIVAENLLYSLSILLPSIIVFISCLVSVISLKRAKKSGMKIKNKGPSKKHQSVSTTILLLSCLFLICNLPVSILLMLLMIMNIQDQIYPGTLFAHVLMYWHGWVIAKVLFTAINATLNPVLYYLRLTEYSRWIRERFNLNRRNQRNKS